MLVTVEQGNGTESTLAKRKKEKGGSSTEAKKITKKRDSEKTKSDEEEGKESFSMPYYGVGVLFKLNFLHLIER